MKQITDCPDVAGKYVLVRSSCNVPLQNGVVQNAYRLTRAVPTLAYLQKAGAKVIVIAHIGRDENDSLKPVLTAFTELLPMQWGGVIGSEEFTQARASMNNGDILLAENLRQFPGESDNTLEFAQLLAAQADIYVNDAFDNVHRDHASMVTVPTLLPAYAGITLFEEVTQLQKAMKPVSPSLLILGGAKFETKMPLVEKYLALYDNVFVTGALMNDILKADGKEVGQSLVSDISLAGEEFLVSPKLIKAADVVAQNERGLRTVSIDGVQPDEKITDMGPLTIAKLAPYIHEAATILWNGPLGLYESGAPGGTHAVAKLIAEAPGYSIIGGGDTVAAIEELGLNDDFGFVSIGGGAMLTLLEHGSTPALDALG
ncbi:MAG: phosphoglycerate kinase [Patescibacteria group bacterium]